MAQLLHLPQTRRLPVRRRVCFAMNTAACSPALRLPCGLGTCPALRRQAKARTTNGDHLPVAACGGAEPSFGNADWRPSAEPLLRPGLPHPRTSWILLALIVVGSHRGGLAEAGDPSAPAASNPYQAIVTRNAVALNPIPVVTNTGPAVPVSPVDVFITGITTLSGVKKVLLQVVDKGKQPDYLPPLVEGDGQGRVEVVSIDPEKGAAVIKIDGNEKTLTLEKDAPKSVAAAGPAAGPARPMVPNPGGAIPLPGMPAVRPATPAGFSPNTTPGATGKMGVMMGGGGGGGVVTSGGTATATARDQALARLEEQRRLYNEAANLNLLPRNRTPPLPVMPGGTGGIAPVPTSPPTQ